MKSLFRLLSPGGSHARLQTFVFHRVLAAPDPLYPEEVTVESFDRICRWIAGWFNVLPLKTAVTLMREDRLPARAAAITFDDGYADNLTLAAPILGRHGLPCTFFVASGFLDGGCMWNDVAIDAVRRTTLGHLDLRSMAGVATNDDAVMLHELKDWPSRRLAINRLIAQLKYLEMPQRDACVAAIADVAGVTPPQNLMLTTQQLQALHRLGFDIGAHTVTHPILARLNHDEARREIENGRERLRDITGDEIALFAYPNGKPDVDYGAAAVEIVRQAGFAAAVTTSWGTSTATTDRFQLARFTPWDRSRQRFAIRLMRNMRHRPSLALRDSPTPC